MRMRHNPSVAAQQFDAGEWPVSFQQRRKFDRDMLRTTGIEIAHDEKTRCLRV
jgi:hypothetical protein